MFIHIAIQFQILGRTIRVDHVEDYKQPKEFGDEDELTKHIRSEGCAPQLPQSEEEESEEEEDYVTPVKKVKKGNHGNHKHRIDFSVCYIVSVKDQIIGILIWCLSLLSVIIDCKSENVMGMLSLLQYICRHSGLNAVTFVIVD